MSSMIFLHGYKSSGHGFKGQFFSKLFPNIHTPDFAGNLHQRMNQLSSILNDQNHWVIIGSSFGGLMGTIYASRHPNSVSHLILLAPALLPPYKPQDLTLTRIHIPTIIIIGTEDTEIPPDALLPTIDTMFKSPEIHLVKDDHSLHSTVSQIDWKKLLKIT